MTFWVPFFSYFVDVVFCSFFVHLGANLRPTWPHLGAKMAQLRTNLGPTWGQHGAKLGQVGPKLALYSSKLVKVGVKLASSGEVGPSWHQNMQV